jgi:glycosyltransferase involved in cell wall biosynthesis
MRILFIAPIPPPIDGQSKASKILLDKLFEENFQIKIVNLNKNNLKNNLKNNSISINRIIEIFSALFKVWKYRKNNDIIYLSLAESFLGNIRDLLIYLICFKEKQKIIIHMLGGAGMRRILTSKGIIFSLNKFFIRKFRGVIIEGPLNMDVYSKIINKEKIHIIPNFAEDYLFADENEIKSKFRSLENIQVLFLSNLLPGKGYNELLDGFILLDNSLKEKYRIVFVGGFESEESKNVFLDKIRPFENVKYLGSYIDGCSKRELYLKSHIFCLPTYYPFEGQPISILEAYATGCVVITTNHSGIPFIFNNTNGYLVESKSGISIMKVLENICNNIENLEEKALFNRNEAFKKFRTTNFQNSIVKIFKG